MADTSGEIRRTISETNRMIQAIVEAESLGHPFWIDGFVKGYYISHRGHVYFTLEDEGFSINCVIFDKIRGTLGFPLTNGVEMEVFGHLQVYDKQATLQIAVEKARQIGRQMFVPDKTVIEQLKQTGLWPKVQRPLPTGIRKVGLITGKNSEGKYDFENTYREHNGKATIKIVDVLLQGEQAVKQIVAAIERLNHQKAVDVIAIVRGGGRAADLATFNHVDIAEAICKSVIPIVTGIGHQRDESFADVVADYAAFTPTAAAHYLANWGREESTLSQTQESKNPHSSTMLQRLVIAVGLLIVILLLILIESNLR